MLSLFPDHADPERLCALGKSYDGEVALSELPRLAAMLVEASGNARFRLDFDKDAENRSVIDVAVAADLRLRCQRCLGVYEERVATRSRLSLVHGPTEAERLPSELDPLLIDDDRVALRDLVEDELILAVPNTPMHAPEACAVDLGTVNALQDDQTSIDGDTGQRPVSPFAALAGLKRSGDTND